jgi:hypothetical protein
MATVGAGIVNTPDSQIAIAIPTQGDRSSTVEAAPQTPPATVGGLASTFFVETRKKLAWIWRSPEKASLFLTGGESNRSVVRMARHTRKSGKTGGKTAIPLARKPEMEE